MKSGQWTAVLLSGMATALAMPAAHAGWVTPSLVSPPPVPTPCNPKPFTTPTPSACLLTGNSVLEALGPGYILRSTFSGPITINNVVVGTVYDRVYCIGSNSTCTTTGADANTYVIATRTRLNSEQWNGHSTESFEINDTVRAMKTSESADAAYWMGPDSGGSTTSSDPDLALANLKWVEQVGRTQYGLNDANMDLRANAYMDFRQDVNANDPDGTSSQWSAWTFARQICSGGVPTTRATFSIKLWEGGEELQDHYTQWMSGYKCT